MNTISIGNLIDMYRVNVVDLENALRCFSEIYNRHLTDLEMIDPSSYSQGWIDALRAYSSWLIGRMGISWNDYQYLMDIINKGFKREE